MFLGYDDKFKQMEEKEKVSYFLNWMGPINKKWCEENGNDWAAGRIDISIPSQEWDEGYGVGVMHIDNWHDLRLFLRELNKTGELLTKEELFSRFESKVKVRWFKNETK